VRAYEDAGVDQLIFVSQAGRNRHEDVCESLELFAREVMPEFKDRVEAGDAARPLDWPPPSRPLWPDASLCDRCRPVIASRPPRLSDQDRSPRTAVMQAAIPMGRRFGLNGGHGRCFPGRRDRRGGRRHSPGDLAASRRREALDPESPADPGNVEIDGRPSSGRPRQGRGATLGFGFRRFAAAHPGSTRTPSWPARTFRTRAFEPSAFEPGGFRLGESAGHTDVE